MSVPSVHGAQVLSARVALEKMLGPEVVARAIASLPAATREAYVGVTSVGWLPIDVFDAFLHAAAREGDRDVTKMVREQSIASAEALLNGLWRSLLRFTSDDALVARTPTIYGKTFNTGRLMSRIDRPGIAEIQQTGWPEIPDLHVAGLAAGIETVLRCAGRESVKVVWKRTPTGVDYTATWRG